MIFTGLSPQCTTTACSWTFLHNTANEKSCTSSKLKHHHYYTKHRPKRFAHKVGFGKKCKVYRQEDNVKLTVEIKPVALQNYFNETRANFLILK